MYALPNRERSRPSYLRSFTPPSIPPIQVSQTTSSNSTPTASNFYSPTDPPSFLLDKETTQKLPPETIASLSKLTKSNIAKLHSSPSIILFIGIIVRNMLPTEPNGNKDKEETNCSNRSLSCGTVVKDIPMLYEIISRTKLAKLNRVNEVVVSMKKVERKIIKFL